MTEPTNKKYTVIELAEVLNVPRTTITDWLVRYSPYIDYKIQGKRKVYTELSVGVLKEISELRNQGLSSFDIEEELAKRHPVHGEIADKQQDVEEEIEPDESENTSLVIRKSMTEMGETIKNTLLEMNRRIEEIEKMNDANASRANLWFAVVVILMFALIATGSFFYLKIEKSYTDNQKLLMENRTYLTELKNAQQQMESNRNVILQKDTEIRKLESGLEKQANEMKENEAAKQAEIDDLKTRNRIAEEKLKLLKELDGARNDKEKMSPLQDTITKQEDELNSQVKKTEEKKDVPPGTGTEPAKEAGK